MHNHNHNRPGAIVVTEKFETSSLPLKASILRVNMRYKIMTWCRIYEPLKENLRWSCRLANWIISKNPFTFFITSLSMTKKGLKSDTQTP